MFMVLSSWHSHWESSPVHLTNADWALDQTNRFTAVIKRHAVVNLQNQLFASQGDEVFNTYGELANWQLLHMYGFAEPSSNNHYDAVSKITFWLFKSSLDKWILTLFGSYVHLTAPWHAL